MDFHHLLDLLDLTPARFYQIYPPPGLAQNIVATTNPVGNGTAAGQLWINSTNNFTWYWDGVSSWVQLIGA